MRDFFWVLAGFAGMGMAAGFFAAYYDTTPPRLEAICAEQEISHYNHVYIGRFPYLLPAYKCAKFENKCVWGHSYDGDKTCEESK